MPRIQYQILNVFAETPFGGNPLAAIEDGTGLSDTEMQLIARQFNLSETTFLLPSSNATARIRIFTPTYEMPFAGHPTLGSAHVVRQLKRSGDEITLEMQAGIIPVHAQGDRWTLAANTPEHRAMTASPAELASMLGLPEAAIAGPALWVSCGNEQAMIPLASPEYVHACKPNSELMYQYSVNNTGKPKAYVFARTANGFESRFFWTPDSGIAEDPGTGSAAANLGGYWLATQGQATLDATILQGTAMGRPNVLSLKVKAGEIHVGGRVQALGQGELHWD
ncbi:PhzF family phenazine biosynthesis protein [Chitinimonas sp. BJB300]|uniref:PhzF family phenazine biosynthesis protein n=1 Tax=Chitinimonas sp. BJB300 TaxID=1559339 RepID=UPI000C0C5B5A|nr:PhzF family phenazine biosynthesis protein [Chitinimonas sp. BJB300]PHV10281.1 phenazine biosynthesis protein PhzC/PhzF [Chitinimonas sp. BJB300]TSJ84788.1 PhzF family phenazine biosynthesis protein [Chitinimonas sp. BJB300]